MEIKEKRNIRARKRSSRKTQDDVVYTQPKPFNRNRFLLHLATVVAVVLALVFGMSIFFKVETVTVSGTVKYDAWSVREASGIVDGENLLSLSKGRISNNIMAKLPYIKEVRVGRELPGTVHIQVTELEVVYAAQDSSGSWWLLNADCKVIDSCAAANAEDYTRILGVELSAPKVGEAAVAYEVEPATDEDGATVPVTVYGRERLDAAVQIMQHMESVGLIGVVATVDVTQLGDIQLWYGNRFQMLLGDAENLFCKIDALSQAVDKMGAYDTGVLDASFTFWPTEVGYSPFS